MTTIMNKYELAQIFAEKLFNKRLHELSTGEKVEVQHIVEFVEEQ